MYFKLKTIKLIFIILINIVSLHGMEEAFIDKESELTEVWKERSNNKEVGKAFAVMLDQSINEIHVQKPKNLLEGVMQLNHLFKIVLEQKESLVRDKKFDVNKTNIAFTPHGMIINGAEIPSHPIFSFWMEKAGKRVLSTNEKVKNLINYVVQELASTVTEDNKEKCTQLIQRRLPKVVADHVGRAFANTYGWYDNKGLHKTVLKVEDGVNVLALSLINSNRVAAVLADHSVRIIDIKTGKFDKTFKSFTQEPLIASNDEKLLIADGSGNNGSSTAHFKVFDIKTEGCLQSFEDDAERFYKFMFFDNARCISSSENGMKIWDISEDKPRVIYHQEAGLEPLKLSNKTLVFFNRANSIHSLEIMDVNTYQSKTIHDKFVQASDAIRVNDEQFLHAPFNEPIELWNIEGKCIQTFKGHSEIICQIVRIDGNTFASCSDDRTIKIWDIKTGACKITIQGFEHMREMQSFGSGILAITSLGSGSTGWCNNFTVRIIDIQNGRCLQSFGPISYKYNFSHNYFAVSDALLYSKYNKLRIIQKPTFEQTIDFLTDPTNKANIKQTKTENKSKDSSSCLIS